MIAYADDLPPNREARRAASLPGETRMPGETIVASMKAGVCLCGLMGSQVVEKYLVSMSDSNEVPRTVGLPSRIEGANTEWDMNEVGGVGGGGARRHDQGLDAACNVGSEN